MNLKSLLAVCATIISTSVAVNSASATTVDIIEFDGILGVTTADGYVEDGYIISSVGGVLAPGVGHPYPIGGYAGSGFLALDGFAGPVSFTLSRFDGGAFNLHSLFETSLDFGGLVASVLVDYGSGSSLSVPPTPVGDNPGDFLIFGPEFSNMMSITVSVSGLGLFNFDHLEVSNAALPPVPVPAGLPLMAGALGLFALAWRRKAA
ncbi:hypothetical protein [Aestuariibius sp. HNIBRBA575]|uniref:hypothetical protein n=1 Tax=Aestuariibius sp. HNIBRBA575 TaxID=3233343 RepID=UPI0034A4894F